MSKPQTSPPDVTTTEHAREFVAEMAGGLVAHASVIRTYAEIGDDAGLLYAARCSAAYLDALRGGIAELERCRAFAMLQRRATRLGPSDSLPPALD